MEKKNQKATGCCSCGADFKKEVNEIVDNVKGYSKEKHDSKKKEVEAAFKKDEPKKVAPKKAAPMKAAPKKK